VTSNDFLVELGTEELPPKALQRLSAAFTRGVADGIDAAGLAHGEVLSYATPRRLAVLVKALATQQPTQQIENRGPPTRLAFDDDGAPTKAAEAFAAKCGVAIEQLDTLETDKGAWLFYKGEAAGEAAATLLPGIVDAALAGLPIPKRMRWGASDTEFVRPAHWLLMVHGADIVPATVLGLAAGNVTYGHRFMAPGAITITDPAAYADQLHTTGKVIAAFAARRELVVAGALSAAAELGGEAILQDEVVDEVTALVEWPVPVAGHFDATFLRLPREVLTYTLQDHQRYFPVAAKGQTEQLQAAFITTSNIVSNQPDEVRRGNERVVLPRLADAEFFWEQDRARPLADRTAALAKVVYQKGLGTLADKTARVATLAAQIATAVAADASLVARAAELSRADLLTEMVGEFPDLQGRMGYYYAVHDGEDDQVAVAIEEQYLPRQAGDRLPATPVGRAVAIADRLDTLAGIFALGKKPSGNKDPFGLRRQALGLVRIIIECNIDIDLPAALRAAAETQPTDADKSQSVADAMYEFIIDRLRAWYLEGLAPGLPKGSVSAEMFAAVAARQPSSLLDFHARLSAVRNFMQHESAASLAAANKRIANILRKADAELSSADGSLSVNLKIFEAQAETTLHDAITQLSDSHARDLAERNYESLLIRLAGLREPVDSYFDEVMVMADDTAQRENRLAQLGQLRKLFLDVADISQIST